MMAANDDPEPARRVDRRAAMASGVAALVLLVGASWWGWDAAHQPVRWRDVGFDIVSPSEATSTFDVFLYSDRNATCRVRALNRSYAEVGVATVAVSRADGAEQRLTVKVATVEPAVTAVVAYCEAD